MTIRSAALHAGLRVALIAAACNNHAHGQPTQIVNVQPDCVINIPLPGMTASGSQPGNGTGSAAGGPAFDNRYQGCTLWYVNMGVSGFSSVTVTLQTAPNSAGAAGTWATFAGQTVTTGSNPSTVTSTPPAATYAVLTGYGAWVRILVSVTGSGRVTGASYGWRQNSARASSPNPPTVIYLTAGASWTVPADWNSANNSIECIGGGGAGFSGDNSARTGAGGGGGAYSKAVNVSLTPGGSEPTQIGDGGSGEGDSGQDTSLGSPALCLAHGGSGANGNSTGGAGGSTSGGVGATLFAGGNGADATGSGFLSGSAGGGAAGPNGAGANGGKRSSASGGGGGGGNGGGTAGSDASGSAGGNGGNNSLGTGGGAGASVAGTNADAGIHGGGGGGGTTQTANVGGNGGDGGPGIEWDASHGSGGGGGGGGNGGGSSGTGIPGAGGLYGGGGGGSDGFNSTWGAGAQGLIRITYVTL